jgi:hypothetical protein
MFRSLPFESYIAAVDFRKFALFLFEHPARLNPLPHRIFPARLSVARISLPSKIPPRFMPRLRRYDLFGV